MTFTPITEIDYSFDLLFYIDGVNKEPVFVKRLICKKSKPKFLMEPLHGVEFSKKIILA